MDANLAARSHERTWGEERVIAGTFCLFGFSCGHAPTIHDEILSASWLVGIENKNVSNASDAWNCLAMANEPIETSKRNQRAWDAPIIIATYNGLLAGVHCQSTRQG